MEKQQTEAFKKFINSKQAEVSDFLCLLGKCTDKLEFLEDRFINFGDDEDGLDERNVRGLASILGDVRSDLRLLEADMMTDVDRDVAEFKKRRAEEKKAAEGPQVNA